MYWQQGVLVAFPLSSYLCTTWGWRSAFWAPSLLGIPCVVLLLIFGSSSPRTSGWIGAAERDFLAESRNDDGMPLTIRWKALLLSAHVWSITFNFFCINWAAWVLLTELPLYLTDLGFDLSAAGWLSDLPSIANAAGSLVFALIADALIVTERASVVATRRMMNGARALSIIHSSCQRL